MTISIDTSINIRCVPPKCIDFDNLMNNLKEISSYMRHSCTVIVYFFVEIFV